MPGAGVLLGLLLCLCPLIAAAERPEPAPAGPALERELARRLARLDEVLELGTFPNDSPLWPARLAAALERRAGLEPAHGLLRSLAVELRSLGTEQPLGPPPEALGGPPAPPPDHARVAILRRVLEVVSRLEDELSGGSTAAPSAARALGALEGHGIRGIVTRRDTGAPIDGATVDVYDGSGFPETSVTSAADGSYDTGPLAAGTYHARAHAIGVLSQFYDGIDCAGFDECHPLSSSPITVGPGYAEGIDFSLVAGARIAGTVTDAETGEEIEVFPWLHDPYGTLLAITGGMGSYGFGDLSPGEYRVIAESERHRRELYDDLPCDDRCPPFSSGTAIVVGDGDVAVADFALDPYPRIRGTVREEGSAAPVAGEQVLLFDDRGFQLESVWTASDGSYAFPGRTPGTYYVRTASERHRNELYDDISCLTSCFAPAGTPVATALGGDTTGIDISLTPYGRIAGTVTEDGTGVPVGIQVSVFSGGSSVASTTTASDGSYLTPELPDGSYYVRTFSLDWDDEVYDDVLCGVTCDLTAGTPVEVSAGTVTGGIDFGLRRIGKITGTVTHAPTGAPLSGVRVELYDSAGSRLSRPPTDAAGTYTFIVPTDTYFLRTDTSQYVDEVYANMVCESCDVTTGTPVAVTSDTTTAGIDFALDRLGFVEGTVEVVGPDDFEGQVHLYDPNGDLVALGGSTLANGYSRLAGLDPGTYYLATWTFSNGARSYQDELFEDVPCEPWCDLSAGTPLTVELNGGIVGLDFVLAACPADSYRTLTDLQIFSTSYLAEACEAVTAQDVTVSSGSTATFRAGRRVVLGDGFVVESGASFKAEIEPGWTED